MGIALRTTLMTSVLMLAAGASLAQSGPAAIEVTTPDGRRALLKSDGTWTYGPDGAASAASPTVQADLKIHGRAAVSGGCHFQFSLHNLLPYEIRSLIPDFRVVRRGGLTYVEQSVGFSRVLPGDQQHRSLHVMGLDCADIEKLQVVGGDRCDMGDLNKFSDGKGLCLARVQVKPSDLLAFEK